MPKRCRGSKQELIKDEASKGALPRLVPLSVHKNKDGSGVLFFSIDKYRDLDLAFAILRPKMTTLWVPAMSGRVNILNSEGDDEKRAKLIDPEGVPYCVYMGLNIQRRISESTIVHQLLPGQGSMAKHGNQGIRFDATDSWHYPPKHYLPWRHSPAGHVPICIGFEPTHGPGTEGVAITELSKGRGMQDIRQRIEPLIPRDMRGRQKALLRIELWPGCKRVSRSIVLMEDESKYVTRTRLGKELAKIFEAFVTQYMPSTVKISPQQLRIMELCSEDGRIFVARVGIVPGRI
ncbi:unnamed protein product [Mycena citricolor]|uniref:Uncharacterized protein n=1 Tax=Mycena citricolor TaxID=2018698 RepID=A0AAD2H5P2_9AGAR|nr:unnamed protein product [Mycena citricolor]